MALSAVKTWIAGEVLFASDLNAEFANIYSNGEDLISPATQARDMNGFALILDADADSSIGADTDDRIDLQLQGVDLFRFDGSAVTSVNGLDFIASATGNDVTIVAQGSDTNINIDVQPKGSGVFTVDGADTFDPIATQVFSF